MTRTRRRAARAAVVLAVLGCAFRASAAESSAARAGQPALMAPDARVREVLSHSGIRSGSAMTVLYEREGSKEGGHFETDAAIKARHAVRAELRANAAAELSAE